MEDLALKATTLVAAETGHEEGHGGGHASLSFEGMLIYLAIVVGILFSLMAIAKKGLNNRYFTHRLTQAFEQLYLFIENLTVGIIGSHGRKYIPLVMLFWMVIFVGNVIALFFPTSITADIGFNFGMAILAIGYVQIEGIRSNGVLGHFAHFAGPKLGLALIPVSLLLFVVELISELMKNVSLSLRLYGNIDGGHRASDAMNALGEGIYVPFGAFLIPIKLLTCVVQALIFSLLFCVYISLVTHHDHDDAHGHGEDAAAHGHAAAH